jgi:hypothetical protein
MGESEPADDNESERQRSRCEGMLSTSPSAQRWVSVLDTGSLLSISASTVATRAGRLGAASQIWKSLSITSGLVYALGISAMLWD